MPHQSLMTTCHQMFASLNSTLLQKVFDPFCYFLVVKMKENQIKLKIKLNNIHIKASVKTNCKPN